MPTPSGWAECVESSRRDGQAWSSSLPLPAVDTEKPMFQRCGPGSRSSHRPGSCVTRWSRGLCRFTRDLQPHDEIWGSCFHRRAQPSLTNMDLAHASCTQSGKCSPHSHEGDLGVLPKHIRVGPHHVWGIPGGCPRRSANRDLRSEEEIFQQKGKGRSSSGRRNSMCKGPEVGGCVVWTKTGKEVGEPRGSMAGVRGGQNQTEEGFQRPHQDSEFHPQTSNKEF